MIRNLEPFETGKRARRELPLAAETPVSTSYNPKLCWVCQQRHSSVHVIWESGPAWNRKFLACRTCYQELSADCPGEARSVSPREFARSSALGLDWWLAVRQGNRWQTARL